MRYLLTSITWSYHRLKFWAHQGHMVDDCLDTGFWLDWRLKLGELILFNSIHENGEKVNKYRAAHTARAWIENSLCIRKEHQNRLLLGVEDTAHVTIEHSLTNLLFLLFSSFFCPFVLYCFTSSVSSTPSRSPKIQEPFTNCYTLLTCGNGGIFSLLDLPNSLVEYNKRLGSKPEKLFQTWFALLVQILNIIFFVNLKISICEEYYDKSMLS